MNNKVSPSCIASTCSPSQAQIERDGFALVPQLLSDEICAHLIEALELPASTCGDASRRIFARRDALQVLAVRELCESGPVGDLMRGLLGAKARAVRGILFDKTPDANWKVPWHQDLTIAVKEKHEMENFTAWSIKDGVPHVQPPRQVLAAMLTIRVHLDDCFDNGPLRVLPTTHRAGRLDKAQIARKRESIEPTICRAARGSALLMKPLLLHASSAGENPGHRRVLHLEWTNEELPAPLQWFW